MSYFNDLLHEVTRAFNAVRNRFAELAASKQRVKFVPIYVYVCTKCIFLKDTRGPVPRA